MSKLAEHVADRLLDDLAILRPAQNGMRLPVDAYQQSLVVEHLLEVRYEPFAIGRVAGEPAADVVVHAARRHRIERGGDDTLGVVGA